MLVFSGLDYLNELYSERERLKNPKESHRYDEGYLNYCERVFRVSKNKIFYNEHIITSYEFGYLFAIPCCFVLDLYQLMLALCQLILCRKFL